MSPVFQHRHGFFHPGITQVVAKPGGGISFANRGDVQYDKLWLSLETHCTRLI